jgi:translation elongation factor EF-1alpha
MNAIEHFFFFFFFLVDLKNNQQVMNDIPSGYFINNVALDTLNVLPGYLLCYGNHNILVADFFLVYLTILNTDVAILPGFTCTVNIHLAEHVVTIYSLNVLLLRHNQHENILNPR